MNPEVVLDAVDKHLGAVETYVNWIIIVAIAVGWAGIRRERMIEAVGVKFDRRHAFFAVAVLYLVANVAILILLLRLGDLMVLLSPDNLGSGVTRLATHEWVLNPFSYFGESGISRLHSGEGYGLLIATWWLCNTSLSTLMDDKSSRPAQALLALFLTTGVSSMLAIQRVYAIVLSRLQPEVPSLFVAISATAVERMVAALLGIAAGALMFTVANVLQTRWLSRIHLDHA